MMALPPNRRSFFRVDEAFVVAASGFENGVLEANFFASETQFSDLISKPNNTE